MNRGIEVLQTSALPLGYGAVQLGMGSIFPIPYFIQKLRHVSLLLKRNGHDVFVPVIGADYGARTRHLHLGKVALYQMS